MINLTKQEYPAPSTPATTAVMRANRKVDTGPELRLRQELHRRGFRFRKHLLLRVSDVRVRPDIVFPRQRLAVFGDGCFWHGCPKHGNQPRHNVHYWRPKLERNTARDQEVTEALQNSGWAVARLWEHVPAQEGADLIEAYLAHSAPYPSGHVFGRSMRSHTSE